VIRIFLHQLPPATRRAGASKSSVRWEIFCRARRSRTLGGPRRFFRAKADRMRGAALGLRRADFLYGRRNVLLDGFAGILIGGK